MEKIERRKFLKVAGAGVASVAAVGALSPVASMVVSLTKSGQLRFRAVTGCPSTRCRHTRPMSSTVASTCARRAAS